MAVLSATVDLDLIASVDHVTNALATQLAADIALTADHVETRLGATLTVLVDLVPTGLATWSQDLSQSFLVDVELDADLTTDPAPVMPSTTALTYVRRLSHTYPNPTLDSNGRPT